MIREWLKPVNEIDRDCIHHWEKLMGIKFNSYDEYAEVDSWIGDMILDYDTKKELLMVYPDIEFDIREYLKMPVKMSKKEAIDILKVISGNEYQHAAFIDFESLDEEERERAREWKKRIHALGMAVKCLERK